jgi:hypothetical protein
MGKASFHLFLGYQSNCKSPPYVAWMASDKCLGSQQLATRSLPRCSRSFRVGSNHFHHCRQDSHSSSSNLEWLRWRRMAHRISRLCSSHLGNVRVLPRARAADPTRLGMVLGPSWTGGLCITAVLGAMFPSFHHLKNTMPESANMTTTQFIGWVVYNLVTIPMLYMPPDKTKRLFIVMNAISLVTLVSIMIWALSKAHGAGPLLSAPATASSGSDLGWAIVKGVTTVIGSIAVGLSMSPFYHL